MRDREPLARNLIRDGYERFIDYCQNSRRLRPRSIGFYRDMNSVLFKKLENAKFGDFDERAIRDLIKSKGNGQEWEKGRPAVHQRSLELGIEADAQALPVRDHQRR